MDKERIYGLDLIRVAAFFAIMIFHVSWSVWVIPPDPYPTFVQRLTELHTRTFAFSGFIIVFLSCFLIGFKSQTYRKIAWLPIFLICGWLIFSFCTFMKEDAFAMEWDIYPLLVVGLLSGMYLLRQRHSVQNIFAGMSVLLLMFPLWELPFIEKVPFYLRTVLFGQCPQDYADWPIFPWLGLMWLGMVCGSRTRENIESGWSFHFRKFEVPLGMLIFLYFWKFRSAYYATPLGDDWSCQNFRHPPYVFWAHMLLWISLIRISFHPGVQKFLASRRIVRAVSNLKMNQHFFLAYLLHYLVIFALIGFLDPGENRENHGNIDAIALLVFPCTELATHGLTYLLYNRKRKREAEELLTRHPERSEA